ncbi:MAG: Hsp33 family molecular chaperone HslO [Eubacterium sp.]|nr:Hsp33 family molecular chaperone HslO [Eubacterium sp.]
MNDYIVRAAAADHAVRAFAITARELTEQARIFHHTSPVVSAALGRLLSAGAMMGAMMKGPDDLLTIQVLGDGPVRGMTVTADAAGHVKGYAQQPQVELDANEMGKLDVGGAVGAGILRVMKDLGLKEPYVGTTQLQTGEIAEDLTYYFASSEQVPSSVGLGVLVDTDCSIRRAGGFILQLMPDTSDAVIQTLEENIKKIRPVTDMLEQGYTPEQLLEELLAGLEMEILERIPAAFACNCSKARIQKALISIPKKDLRDMIEDGEPIEVKCQFCNTAYPFEIEELKEMLAQCEKDRV